MGILRGGLFRSGSKSRFAKAASRFCVDEDGIDMRKDIERQSHAAKALQTYVEEVVAGFETLLLAHEKLSDRVFTELHEVGLYLDGPLNKFGRAIGHLQEMVSQTTVALQVHQEQLTTCSAELARADQASAALLCMGVALNASKVGAEHDVDSNVDLQVSATASKGRRRQRAEKDREQLARRIHAAKVQQAYAHLAFEACVSRKETLKEIYRKSLEAVARTVSSVDETAEVDVLDMTVRCNSTLADHIPDLTSDEAWNPFGPDVMKQDTTITGHMPHLTYDETWNPFGPDLMTQDTKDDDSMHVKLQISSSTWDTIAGSGISKRCSDTPCTSTITAHMPDFTCDNTRNPLGPDLMTQDTKDDDSMPLKRQISGSTWDTSSGNSIFKRCSDTSSQSANNPLNEDTGMRL